MALEKQKTHLKTVENSHKYDANERIFGFVGFIDWQIFHGKMETLGVPPMVSAVGHSGKQVNY